MRLFRHVAVFAAPAIVVAGILANGTAHASVAAQTPAQRTCAAFSTWDHKRTTANLNAMLTVSESAPWKYVGEDAAGLYTDVRSGKTGYIAEDVKYFGEDC
jgi:hypothetical protein